MYITIWKKRSTVIIVSGVFSNILILALINMSLITAT